MSECQYTQYPYPMRRYTVTYHDGAQKDFDASDCDLRKGFIALSIAHFGSGECQVIALVNPSGVVGITSVPL